MPSIVLEMWDRCWHSSPHYLEDPGSGELLVECLACDFQIHRLCHSKITRSVPATSPVVRHVVNVSKRFGNKRFYQRWHCGSSKHRWSREWNILQPLWKDHILETLKLGSTGYVSRTLQLFWLRIPPLSPSSFLPVFPSPPILLSPVKTLLRAVV